MKKRALAFVLSPLAIGALAYFVSRAPDRRLHAWAAAIGLGDLVRLRGIVHLPAIISGSLPDAMWAFAFGSALGLVWNHRGWMIAGAIGVMSVELGQAIGAIPGVFDVVDLISMTLAYALGWRISSSRIFRADTSSTRSRDALRRSPP